MAVFVFLPLESAINEAIGFFSFVVVGIRRIAFSMAGSLKLASMAFRAVCFLFFKNASRLLWLAIRLHPMFWHSAEVDQITTVGFWWSSSTLDQGMRRSLLFVVGSQQDRHLHTPSQRCRFLKGTMCCARLAWHLDTESKTHQG